MIGQIVTDPKTGEPLDDGGNKLEKSKYNPPQQVRELFARVQKDYQIAWRLQRKPLDEFDGHSLLDRAKLDQETFAAFVGLQYVPRHKKWRWQGRKNTARNKLISILAHLIASMLYPYVFAQNDQEEEDKATARVMRILIEEKLRKADYEIKFFYSILSILVNPAAFIEMEYVEMLQTIRQRAQDGTITMKEVVDESVSGLLMHVLPIDEILIGDLYSGTGDVKSLPFYFRVRRISYDQAKAENAGRFYYEGKDVFDYVEAGKTKWLNEHENNTLFDIDWNEADGNFVQELTVRYKGDDLELKWIGGVGMFDHGNPYDSPFTHRRMMIDKKTGEWNTVPVYPLIMGGFEPIDPTGRFAYFKSGAFKEYWDDKKINELDRMLVDGVKLDVFKPMFLAGIANVDATVMAPGATVGMPAGATATSYVLGPNLVAAHNAINSAEGDMSESTQDKIMQGSTEANVTATQTREARNNARIFLGVAGFAVANMVKQIGELTADIVIQHDTIGEVEGFAGGSLSMKYKTLLAQGKEKGRDVTNRIIFTDKYIGRRLSKKRAKDIEWELFEKAGGIDSKQRIWEINPYKFARTSFSYNIEADRIVQESMGTDRLEKDQAFERLMDPRVLPFIDPEAVVQDFVIDEYAKGDPDRYSRKDGQEELIEAMLSQVGTQPDKELSSNKKEV